MKDGIAVVISGVKGMWQGLRFFSGVDRLSTIEAALRIPDISDEHRSEIRKCFRSIIENTATTLNGVYARWWVSPEMTITVYPAEIV